MAIKLKDIALAVGVSQPAVTAVLNGTRPGCVGKAKRELIFQIARENNYVPDHAARVLALGRTGIVQLLQPVSGPMPGQHATYGQVLHHLSLQLKRKNLTLAMTPLPDAEIATIRNAVTTISAGRQADALIALATFMNKVEISANALPMVTFAMPSDGCQEISALPGVRIDSLPAMKAVLDHLHRTGKNNILYLTMQSSFASRIDTYCALEEHPVVKVPTKALSRQALDTYEFLAARRAELRAFDAVVAANDHLAWAAQRALSRPGSVMTCAGFDAMPEYAEEPFISIRPRLPELAGAVAELLFARLKKNPPPPEIVTVEAEVEFKNMVQFP